MLLPNVLLPSRVLGAVLLASTSAVDLAVSIVPTFFLAVCVLFAMLTDAKYQLTQLIWPQHPPVVVDVLANSDHDNRSTASSESARSKKDKVDPTVGLITPQAGEFATALGLRFEDHRIVCPDGHVLIAHRFRKPDTPRDARPVILQHGLLQRGGVFITANGRDSLALLLARSGYDVWVGNTRASFPLHTKYTTSDDGYWDYGIDEISKYDFPSLVRYVTSSCHPDAPKPVYVGHSQGVTQALLAFTQKPSLSSELALFVALAPAFYLRRPNTYLMGTLMPNMKHERIVQLFGSKVFIGIMNIVQKYFPAYLFMILGSRMFSYLFAWHYYLWRRETMTSMFQFTPAPTGVNLISQWMASIRAGKIVSRHTGEPVETPSITGCPVSVMWGSKDDIIDAPRLITELKENGAEIVMTKEVGDYGHLDPIWAADAPQVIFQPLMDLISKLK